MLIFAAQCLIPARGKTIFPLNLALRGRKEIHFRCNLNAQHSNNTPKYKNGNDDTRPRLGFRCFPGKWGKHHLAVVGLLQLPCAAAWHAHCSLNLNYSRFQLKLAISIHSLQSQHLADDLAGRHNSKSERRKPCYANL